MSNEVRQVSSGFRHSLTWLDPLTLRGLRLEEATEVARKVFGPECSTCWGRHARLLWVWSSAGATGIVKRVPTVSSLHSWRAGEGTCG